MHLRPQGRHRFATGGRIANPKAWAHEPGCEYLIPYLPTPYALPDTWESSRQAYPKPSGWAWLKRWMHRG